MKTDYHKEDKVLMAVDCIVFGFDGEDLKILLIKRDFESEKGKWSLMGGFLKQNENLDQAADRVLHDLTGIQDVYLEQLYTYSDVHRDPVDRTVSVSYYALINILDHDKELIQKYSAKWFLWKECPNLIFDHNHMVEHAIQRLRYRTSTQPIGFELLPPKFTMRQLQSLYEAILDKTLDKRNFTSKVQSLDILRKLTEKETGSSKKGAFLYTFDKINYDAKIREGFQFRI